MHCKEQGRQENNDKKNLKCRLLSFEYLVSVGAVVAAERMWEWGEGQRSKDVSQCRGSQIITVCKW